MTRSEPRCARAIRAARIFLGTLLSERKEGLCRVESAVVLKTWKQLRGRKPRGVPWVSGNAFLRALHRVGAVRQRVRLNSRLAYVWCAGCTHGLKGRTQDEQVEVSHVEESGEESGVELSEKEETDTEASDMVESDEESDEEPDDEALGGADRKVSLSAYRNLQRRCQRLKSKLKQNPPPRLFAPDGSYSSSIITALQLIRSHGIGAESAGILLSDILECVVGKRGKGRNISPNTVKQTDSYNGASTWVPFLRKIKEAGGERVQMAMDTSSGSRRQAGMKYSQVSLTARNPNSDSRRVLQVLVDSTVGDGGRAKDKVDQIRRVQEVARQNGFETPTHCVVDHENSAVAACRLAGLETTGCSTHKLKHMIESVQIPENISSAMTTLHTASCAASTNATTSTGLKLKSSLIASAGGRLPKGFRLERQVGNKYAWLARSCASVLHNREKLIDAALRKELFIPGSDAVDVLLSDSNKDVLAVAAISYAAFKACMVLLKLDENSEGELNVIEARKLYPDCRNIILRLSRVQRVFPDWLTIQVPKNSLGLEAAKKLFTSQTASLLRAAAKAMLAKFDAFVAKDSDEMTPTRGSDLPHSNDYIEGAHGTLSIIQDRLPNANPERVASLAQRRHNNRALKKMGVPLVPSPNTHASLKKRKLSSNEEVQRRVHRTAMTQQLRTEYTKKTLVELREVAEAAGLSIVDLGNKLIKRSELIDLLVDANYQPPCSPEPLRRKLF